MKLQRTGHTHGAPRTPTHHPTVHDPARCATASTSCRVVIVTAPTTPRLRQCVVDTTMLLSTNTWWVRAQAVATRLPGVEGPPAHQVPPTHTLAVQGAKLRPDAQPSAGPMQATGGPAQARRCPGAAGPQHHQTPTPSVGPSPTVWLPYMHACARCSEHPQQLPHASPTPQAPAPPQLGQEEGGSPHQPTQHLHQAAIRAQQAAGKAGARAGWQVCRQGCRITQRSSCCVHTQTMAL